MTAALASAGATSVMVTSPSKHKKVQLERGGRAEQGDEEEAAYQEQLAEAIALSASGDSVVPPPPKTKPTKPQREVYHWTSYLCEWVSALPIWLGTIPEHEEAYLLQWKSQHLRAERAEGHQRMDLAKE
ncbi:hypothetical protein D1007_20694 [Hordeum vulgare]|nr:hypothetical protein D1007_20694 [Hordeum vulgare]